MFSVAHERVSHDHEHDHHTTARLQPTRKGLALCSHITLDVTTAPWVPAKNTHGTRGPREGRGWPDNRPRHETTARQRQALSQTCETTNQVLTDAVDSCTVAEQRDDHMTDESNTSSTRSKRSPGSSGRSRRRNETHHPREDQPGDRTHQAERDQAHQDFRRISTLTKLLMCLSQCSERFLRFKRCTESVRQRDPTSGIEIGPPIQ